MIVQVFYNVNRKETQIQLDVKTLARRRSWLHDRWTEATLLESVPEIRVETNDHDEPP